MCGKTGGRKRGSKDSKKRNRRTLKEDEKTARRAKIRERNNSLANAAKRGFMGLFKTADEGTDTDHDQEEHSDHSSTGGHSAGTQTGSNPCKNTPKKDAEAEERTKGGGEHIAAVVARKKKDPICVNAKEKEAAHAVSVLMTETLQLTMVKTAHMP